MRRTVRPGIFCQWFASANLQLFDICCVIATLIFPKNIWYFHKAVSLEIGTLIRLVCSIYLHFPGKWEGTSINNKHLSTRCEISPSLTIKQHHWHSFRVFIVKFEWILTPSVFCRGRFEHDFVFWVNSKCYLFVQKWRPKIWSMWTPNELVPAVLFSEGSLCQVFFVSSH